MKKFIALLLVILSLGFSLDAGKQKFVYKIIEEPRYTKRELQRMKSKARKEEKEERTQENEFLEGQLCKVITGELEGKIVSIKKSVDKAFNLDEKFVRVQTIIKHWSDIEKRLSLECRPVMNKLIDYIHSLAGSKCEFDAIDENGWFTDYLPISNKYLDLIDKKYWGETYYVYCRRHGYFFISSVCLKRASKKEEDNYFAEIEKDACLIL